MWVGCSPDVPPSCPPRVGRPVKRHTSCPYAFASELFFPQLTTTLTLIQTRTNARTATDDSVKLPRAAIAV